MNCRNLFAVLALVSMLVTPLAWGAEAPPRDQLGILNLSAFPDAGLALGGPRPPARPIAFENFRGSEAWASNLPVDDENKTERRGAGREKRGQKTRFA